MQDNIARRTIYRNHSHREQGVGGGGFDKIPVHYPFRGRRRAEAEIVTLLPTALPITLSNDGPATETNFSRKYSPARSSKWFIHQPYLCHDYAISVRTFGVSRRNEVSFRGVGIRTSESPSSSEGRILNVVSHITEGVLRGGTNCASRRYCVNGGGRSSCYGRPLKSWYLLLDTYQALIDRSFTVAHSCSRQLEREVSLHTVYRPIERCRLGYNAPSAFDRLPKHRSWPLSPVTHRKRVVSTLPSGLPALARYYEADLNPARNLDNPGLEGLDVTTAKLVLAAVPKGPGAEGWRIVTNVKSAALHLDHLLRGILALPNAFSPEERATVSVFPSRLKSTGSLRISWSQPPFPSFNRFPARRSVHRPYLHRNNVHYRFRVHTCKVLGSERPEELWLVNDVICFIVYRVALGKLEGMHVVEELVVVLRKTIHVSDMAAQPRLTRGTPKVFDDVARLAMFVVVKGIESHLQPMDKLVFVSEPLTGNTEERPFRLKSSVEGEHIRVLLGRRLPLHLVMASQSAIALATALDVWDLALSIRGSGFSDPESLNHTLAKSNFGNYHHSHIGLGTWIDVLDGAKSLVVAYYPKELAKGERGFRLSQSVNLGALPSDYTTRFYVRGSYARADSAVEDIFTSGSQWDVPFTPVSRTFSTHLRAELLEKETDLYAFDAMYPGDGSHAIVEGSAFGYPLVRYLLSRNWTGSLKRMSRQGKHTTPSSRRALNRQRSNGMIRGFRSWQTLHKRKSIFKVSRRCYKKRRSAVLLGIEIQSIQLCILFTKPRPLWPPVPHMLLRALYLEALRHAAANLQTVFSLTGPIYSRVLFGSRQAHVLVLLLLDLSRLESRCDAAEKEIDYRASTDPLYRCTISISRELAGHVLASEKLLFISLSGPKRYHDSSGITPMALWILQLLSTHLVSMARSLLPPARNGIAHTLETQEDAAASLHLATKRKWPFLV
ncbi:hypothetical protein DFP72DRAFT_854084 [Ephemerocybe angulata]|uniref:Uncharacterized protein n=1 Tax=Ephemerocybe angulata TaxID=980116 RepID=A0A8H6HJ47_9AGAR|nr:hypothetical protein DFP72DRAFT_854084 [Tulosesus angulatus]